MHNSEKGMVLIIVLIVMALMTAMVVEFAGATYTANAALSNWRDAQRLSLTARSGIHIVTKVVSDNYDRYSYTYPGSVEMPVPGITDDFEGQLLIKITDENAKFNLNSLVLPNSTLNQTAYESFRRLLRILALDENIADRVADWIDRDTEPRIGQSEEGAKNTYMDSVDELWLIEDSKVCEKLLPFVTVYGMGEISANIININTASVTVLMMLDDMMTDELAGRIESYRSLEPFQKTSDIVKVAGFEGSLGQSLIGRIAVKASNFRITSVAEQNRMKRIIECVMEKSAGGFKVRYWQEM
jgi:general secretion pathway protein K